MKSNYRVQQTPGVTILSEDQINEIHLATLEVLERTGVKVYAEEALDLLRDAGCRISKDNIVKIPSYVVSEAIASAPKRVTIANRNGIRSIFLEGNKTYFGPAGVSAPFILDSYTGRRRPLTKKDIENAARIVDYLPNIDFIMVNGLISDVPREMADLYEFETVLNNTTKPIVLITQNRENLSIALEMAKEVAGSYESLRENPFVLSHPEPSSPLFHTKEALEKLLYSAEIGIPLIYVSAIMSGATAPATLAGTLVVVNAETLSGLVIAQLKRKGTPFITGGIITVMDMSTGVLSYGAPEKDLLMAAFVDIAHYYKLPVWGTGGNSDSKVVDQQAAIEATMSCLMSALSGANMVHDPGYLESGLSVSHEMLVMTDEIIGMVKRIMRGIEVDEDHLAVDVIGKVGPQGNFLAEDHTVKHFRKEHWRPNLLDRQLYDLWIKDGGKTLGERLNEKVKCILTNHKPVPLSEHKQRRISLLLKNFKDRMKIVG